jgi:protein-L-isoaspartate(D-aspartate) O-methyltransferase
MQGAGECRERLVILDGEAVGLRLDDGQQIDAGLLREALSQPRVESWSEVTLGSGERFDGLHLWLAVALPAVIAWVGIVSGPPTPAASSFAMPKQQPS